MTANQINFQKHLEDVRHNTATEKQAQSELAEVIRHNVTTETETARHNRAYEYETNRHNLVGESIDRAKVFIQQGNLAETIRHNTAQEEVSRQNVAVERDKLNEQHRHNVNQEILSGVDIAVDAGTEYFRTIVTGLTSLAGSIFKAK